MMSLKSLSRDIGIDQDSLFERFNIMKMAVMCQDNRKSRKAGFL